MTKRELNQVYYINKEIEMWQRELENVADLKSPKLDGMPKSPGVGDPTGSRAARAAEISEIIEGLLNELQMKRKEIYEYIATLNDPVIRQIIMYRCLSLCTWEEVAIYIGGKNTPDSVRMAFNRFVPD